jgi:hypothetical protein
MSRQEKSRQSVGAALLASILVAATLLVAAATGRPAGVMTLLAQDDEVQIALSASGFTPAEVTHAAGTFALAVENQDAASEHVLRLRSADGTLLNEVRVQKGAAVWTVDLAAGQYTLTVADHPDWVCTITVQ